MSLVSIPEVTIHILTQLRASRYDDTSVRTLVACTKASRTLRDVARTDSLWASHCRVRWSKPELDEKEQQDWYQLYSTRRQRDRDILALLDEIITNPSARGAAAVKIIEQYEYAWDVLRMEAMCRVPEGVKDVWKKEEDQWASERWVGIGEEWIDGTGKRDTNEDDGQELDTRDIDPDWIQRRWWAKQALGTIARKTSMLRMLEVFYGEQPDPTSRENARNFEEGIKALSGLMGVNTSEISRNYDKLAKACKEKLIQNGVSVDPTSTEFDLKAFSSGVCDWMRSQGFKRASDGRYYDLMNHFPHTFMTTNRGTLPISLVYTFVAIVTRLGLLAEPVGFPGHVHAWVALPSYRRANPNLPAGVDETDWEEEEPVRRCHIDVFHSDTAPFLASEDMRRKLEDFQVPGEQWRLLTRPSLASEMVLRAANNILLSVTRIQHLPTLHTQVETRAATLYASAMTYLIARPHAADAARFVGGVVSVIKEQFPLDTEPVLTHLLKFMSNPENSTNSNPEIAMHLRNSIGRLRGASVDVKRRDKEKYWVGMIFRHAKYSYVGVIVGRDPECKAEERWIVEAGVDALPRGRWQPFYTVLADDGSSRYVAEENVVALPSLAAGGNPEHKLNWGDVRKLMLEGTSTIEQTFTRAEVNEELGRARFVPAASTVEEYPDDMQQGKEYMEKPWHRY